jgi:hypothetical protein
LDRVRFAFLLRNLFAVLFASLFLTACGGELVSPVPAVTASKQSLSIMKKQTRFVYQIEPSSQWVNGFRYTSQGLRPLAGFPITLREPPGGLEFVIGDPLGRFLYIVSSAASEHALFVYSVDPATGALTLRQTIPMPLWPAPPVLSPDGKDVYFATSLGIAQYQVASDTGLLSLRGYFPVAEDTYIAGIDSLGRFLIGFSNYPSLRMRTITLDASSGEPVHANAAIDPGMMFAGPRFTTADGNYLFVANQPLPGDSHPVNLGVFYLSPGGDLMPMGQYLIGLVPDIANFTMDGSGRFLYGISRGMGVTATSPAGGVRGFIVGRAGDLHPMTSVGAATPDYATFRPSIAASADGKMLFVEGNNLYGGVRQYVISPNGQLSERPPVNTGPGEVLVTLDAPVTEP